MVGMSCIVGQDKLRAIKPRLSDQHVGMNHVERRRHRRPQLAALSVVFVVPAIGRDFQTRVVNDGFFNLKMPENIRVIHYHIGEVDALWPEQGPPRRPRSTFRRAGSRLGFLQHHSAFLDVKGINFPAP